MCYNLPDDDTSTSSTHRKQAKHCHEPGDFHELTFSFAASIDYIHNNPVQRKLFPQAADWKWSSAGYYLLDPPRQQLPDLPHIHGIPAGAFDKSQPR